VYFLELPQVPAIDSLGMFKRATGTILGKKAAASVCHRACACIAGSLPTFAKVAAMLNASTLQAFHEL
jgi:hypothetical protein